MNPIFITGIGTDVGKTIIAAILAEALQADYWKPVQAGFENGTDSMCIRKLLTNKISIVHPEIYLLKFAASPHISAFDEGKEISLEKILERKPVTDNRLIIEGAGGLMAPLNKKEFAIDLIQKLNASVIIVSRNYIGSINHSLLTAEMLKQKNIPVMGWIFNDEYLDYETEIALWSGFPWIASVRKLTVINKSVILEQSIKMLEHIKIFL